MAVDPTLSLEQQAHDLQFWKNKMLAKEMEKQKEQERMRQNKEALRTKEKFKQRCQFLGSFYQKDNETYQKISESILKHISEAFRAESTDTVVEKEQAQLAK